jgi:hypothetical protein
MNEFDDEAKRQGKRHSDIASHSTRSPRNVRRVSYRFRVVSDYIAPEIVE